MSAPDMVVEYTSKEVEMLTKIEERHLLLGLNKSPHEAVQVCVFGENSHYASLWCDSVLEE